MSQVPPEQLDDLDLTVHVGSQVPARALQAHGEPVPDELAEVYRHADETVFSKIRMLFGGNLREALSGGAGEPGILEFFYAAGVPVMEGYGEAKDHGRGPR